MKRPHHLTARVALLGLTATTLAGLAGLSTTAPASAKPQHKADLATLAVSDPAASAAPGATFDVTAKVANKGAAKARPGKVTFYLSADAKPSANDTVAGSAKVKALAPRSKKTVKATVAVPAGTTDGSYHLLACVGAGKGKGRVDSSAKAGGGNDCRAAKGEVAVTGALKGTLTGTLTYTRSSATHESGEWGVLDEKSSDQLTVNVNVDVDESRVGDWAQFKSVGSNYTYTGTHTKLDSDNRCRVDVNDPSSGGGAIVQTGDRYYDPMYADFTRTDHSKIRMLLSLTYSHVVTTTRTALEEDGCGGSTGTTTEPARTGTSVQDMELTRTGQVGNKVTYAVTTLKGDMSVPTTWQQVTGTLTLTLK